ncbi:MAG: ATP-binding cassette domain-containing protein [Alphaproteobacteria bacterium]|jgi:peptide/nickel transport system ATP-binding protein|nr:ATP-binding cassette domain-containing protein [Alphaproteobacteria bacterium]MDP6832776.1 ATP-binding cassette domain-containing protein [Alphaproteobacteria bacterium]
MSETVLHTVGLRRQFTLPRESLFRPPETVFALNGVDLSIQRGRSLGVVGESGCGKSTLARLCMALDTPTAGHVEVLGRDLSQLSAMELRQARAQFQMVFQDPYGSLDPRHTVRRIVGETLEALAPRQGDGTSGVSREEAIGQAIDAVGLRRNDLDKYPHEFSGGQRQRIAIARALVTRPSLIVADEPVSALDVSVQAQVLNLMQELQQDFGVTYMLISHDLGVVDYVCDEVAVMYLGRVVELAGRAQLFAKPCHPYTKALFDAVPRIGAGRRSGADRASTLQGSVSSQTRQITGCAFADRCPRAESRCLDEAPELRRIDDGHMASCHFA